MAYSKLAIDLTGKTFGYLVVLARAGSRRRVGVRGGVKALWRCRCTCGEEVVVPSQRLRAGRSKACAKNGHRYYPYGDAAAPRVLIAAHPAEYNSWRRMHERCSLKSNNKKHRAYGGRGIRVCARWARLDAFVADMGRKPSAAHTLDRIDVNGNYEPGNCRWATPVEQARNTRRATYVWHAGKRILLIELAEQLGLSSPMIYGRLKLGWSLDEALAIPVRRYVKKRKAPV